MVLTDPFQNVTRFVAKKKIKKKEKRKQKKMNDFFSSLFRQKDSESESSLESESSFEEEETETEATETEDVSEDECAIALVEHLENDLIEENRLRGLEAPNNIKKGSMGFFENPYVGGMSSNDEAFLGDCSDNQPQMNQKMESLSEEDDGPTMENRFNFPDPPQTFDPFPSTSDDLSLDSSTLRFPPESPKLPSSFPPTRVAQEDMMSESDDIEPPTLDLFMNNRTIIPLKKAPWKVSYLSWFDPEKLKQTREEVAALHGLKVNNINL